MIDWSSDVCSSELGRGAMAQEIYFATNRRVVKDGADAEISEEFHPDIDELRFGRVSFTGKNLYKKDLDDFVGKAKITVAEEDMEDGDDPQKLGRKAIFQKIGRAQV